MVQSLEMLDITAIPAFEDNYIWLLRHGSQAVLVDPGDGEAALQSLDEHGLELCGVLVTHHHGDHVGGLARIARHADVPVYGPAAEAARIPGLTTLLHDGDRFSILGRTVEVIAVPGHTLGHIAYHLPDARAVFCGDTLFSAGCGRLFEGTAEQMHTSLQKLAALPPETAVYCAHEYTLSNLAFAQAVEPENAAVAERIAEVRRLRDDGQPSLPSSIGLELGTNPFLRTAAPSVCNAVAAHGGDIRQDWQVFASLRQWKDGFRAI